MQTFLPYPDFAQSAKVLDRQRLGKQRVEVLQLLKALKTNGAWSNHPAALMWKGYEPALVLYGLTVCNEWIRRGYKDTCYGKIFEYYPQALCYGIESPPWLGNKDFHDSHKSNLMRKNPEHYSQYFNITPDLEYVWPVRKGEYA